ncbi:MAG TPA: bifunctional diaminohydroxyphosphoribosylaminopyrimidine deaminase/5-amino-6-(5-phosphoribosylamino)uracil reductase RibD, partial [Candidatus Acidoferrales bacterium]|nr:bifunctional diaminohydroxyphosphoribosylaminopyrimidine deaminase/5-amino-6-(5-phosphoribosylamino)uracil reductase RibD [Candidatus Acidoferrales bacterium]
MRPRDETDRRFMRKALSLAESRLGRTSPNPVVGCVLVRGAKVVARGVTGDGGRPHAETVAIAKAGRRARGTTAYVTFEPCAHFGQTPPCARARVEAGVKRVVVGCVDPDPRVRGRGIAILKRAGIAVTMGVLADNPRLTCRVAGGRDPVRVVIDARLRTSPTARVYRQKSSAGTVLVTTPANLARARRRYAH